MNRTIESCWIITEGMAGTENQCIGVAQALGLNPVIKRITLKQPWKTLSPWLAFEHAAIFTPPLSPPWPDLLLTSGRKSIAAARYIKKASQDKTYSVHIQDPRVHPAHFDLVAVPAHDRTRGDNVIITTAAPNRITPKRLSNSLQTFPEFEKIRTPRVAVLIGGSSKTYTLTPNIMRALATKLKTLDAGLMITTSRRTGTENEKILRGSLADTSAWIWDGKGENPYFALLGWADFILVTADSASMLSEAASTGKPVYMIPLEGGKKRFDALHKNLINSGAVRMFEGKLESWRYTPLNDAEKVAHAIRAGLSARAR